MNQTTHTVVLNHALRNILLHLRDCWQRALVGRTASDTGTPGERRVFGERVKRLIWPYMSRFYESSQLNS